MLLKNNKFMQKIWINFSLILGYYLTAKLSLVLASLPGNITAIWLPSGLSLAAVLLLGYEVVPSLIIGSILTTIKDLREARLLFHKIKAILSLIGHLLLSVLTR